MGSVCQVPGASTLTISSFLQRTMPKSTLQPCESIEDQNARDEEIKAATENLSEEKLLEYKDIFSFFDRDGGGFISSLELGQVMRTFGWSPTESELQELISEIDQDGNGEISFNEFVWLMTRDLHDDEIEDEIREAFRCFDKEGHGFIPVTDLSRVLQNVGDKLSESETEEFLTEADLDGDGNVNYEEFVMLIFKKSTFQDKVHEKQPNGWPSHVDIDKPTDV